MKTLLLLLCLQAGAAEPTTIPAPTQAPAFIGNGGGYPSPAGTYEVAYTLVDSLDRHTGRSPCTKFTAKAGWRAVVTPNGINPNSPAVAVCYWWNDAGTWRIFGGPVYCENPAGCTRPYFPLAGWQYHWAQGHVIEPTILAEFNWNKYWWPTWADARWKKSSTIPSPAQAPTIRVYDSAVPLGEFQVAYSWACNEGETALSPPTQVAATTWRQSVDLMRNIIPPNGALGMFVYARGDDKRWHRQPAPHIVTPNGPNDYLWRLDSNVITLRQYQETGILPSGGPGVSYLSEIHKKIDGGAGHVILTGDQTIYCPVIMPQSNAYGDSMFRTVGLANGGMWRMKTAATGTLTAWPMWLETSQHTRLVGCWMSSSTANAGIAFCDCGSGAYHFRSERLRIDELTAPNAAGIITTNESRSASGHSCSEPVFYDTVIRAKFPVVVEWSQSANWNFDYLTANGNGEYDSAIITQSNSGFVNMRGRMTADSARAMFALTAASRLDAENIFTDRGFPEWIVCSYRAAPNIDLSVKGMNIRIPFIHLLTATNPNTNRIGFKLRCTNTEDVAEACTFTTRYNGIAFVGDSNTVTKKMTAQQPTLAEWAQSRYWMEWDNGAVPTPPSPPVTFPPQALAPKPDKKLTALADKMILASRRLSSVQDDNELALIDEYVPLADHYASQVKP